MLSKKGLRNIKYNGLEYGWKIRSKPTYRQGAFETPMTLAVQSMVTDSPKILHVTLNITRPDNWINPHNLTISPKIIKDIIEKALKSGWQYDKGGKPYEFKYIINTS
ncbi:MAG: hypothetical protein MJB14_18160 [Spirochaetes bacterium]|nr:hypothetical protein [Spirochaetota bacterium]